MRSFSAPVVSIGRGASGCDFVSQEEYWGALEELPPRLPRYGADAVGKRLRGRSHSRYGSSGFSRTRLPVIRITPSQL